MTTSPTLTVRGFLVVDAAGNMKVLKSTPRLAFDEVAFPVAVRIPRTWGRVQSTSIEVTMPEPPEALVIVDDPLEPGRPDEPLDGSTQVVVDG